MITDCHVGVYYYGLLITSFLPLLSTTHGNNLGRQGKAGNVARGAAGRVAERGRGEWGE